MNRILLADDSPHAQRMGERILRDEGYDVVSVTDGETALLRMADLDPDLILADVFLPGRSGLDICAYVKTEPAHRHVRIVLTAGMLEPFDEDQARAAGADAIIKKPFEASVVIDTIKPLMAAAHIARKGPEEARDGEPVPAEPLAAPPAVTVLPPKPPPEPVPERPARPAKVVTEFPRQEWKRPVAAPPPPPPPPPAPVPAPAIEPELLPSGTGVSEEELLRAAVTLALDAAFPALVEDITAKVLRNLRAAGGEALARDGESAAGIPVPVAPLPDDH